MNPSNKQVFVHPSISILSKCYITVIDESSDSFTDMTKYIYNIIKTHFVVIRPYKLTKFN